MRIRLFAVAVVLATVGCTGSGDGEEQLTPVATLDPAVHEAATRLSEASGDLSKAPMFQQVVECVLDAGQGTAPGQIADDLISEWESTGQERSLLAMAQNSCKELDT